MPRSRSGPRLFPNPPFISPVASSGLADSLGGGLFNILGRVVGFSAFASLFTGSGSNVLDVFWLFVLGSIVEAGRRLCYWAVDRFKIQYLISAEFVEGDPAYEWLINFLVKQDVWRHSKDFTVLSKTSELKSSISMRSGDAEYIPKYNKPHLFKWKGYWAEIQSTNTSSEAATAGGGSHSIILTLYTLDLEVLSNLIEEAHELYIEGRRPHVIVHSNDSFHRGSIHWDAAKRKKRRPLDSIVLPEGTLQSIVQDIKDFLASEDWYLQAGIPYRRGYLLYGPPGTGKTSTIYALAGELGLEIYSLSLSSGSIDDDTLQRAVSLLPKRSILLLEDIDCAFPSREEEDLPIVPIRGIKTYNPNPTVTMSGLLNVLDGVGSEDGKLFFATTNYFDRLDPALIRPGRIDKKVEYKLVTPSQARTLFERFYPLERASTYFNIDETKASMKLEELGPQFAAKIPEGELTMAELQGYLLPLKKNPEEAVLGVTEWVESERAERQRRKEVEDRKKEKAREQALQVAASTRAVYPPPIPSYQSEYAL